MKSLAAIGALLLALALAACGGSGDAGESSAAQPRPPASRSQEPVREKGLAMGERAIAKLPPIEIERRSGPPPRKLEVNDLRKGFGAAVTPNDNVTVDYYSVRYGEALRKSHTGEFGETKFGLDSVVEGWELGLPGMKVGGRRELVVPGRLAYPGEGAIVYVIDLLAVERD